MVVKKTTTFDVMRNNYDSSMLNMRLLKGQRLSLLNLDGQRKSEHARSKNNLGFLDVENEQKLNVRNRKRKQM